MFLELVSLVTGQYVFASPQPHGFLLVFVVVGVAGLVAAIAPLTSSRRSVRWLLVSLLLIVCEAPDVPTVAAVNNELYRNHRVNGPYVGKNILNGFHEHAGHYPTSQQELDNFVAAQEDSFLHQSWFARRGSRVPYRFVYVASASGPYTPNPPGADPATIYCAVSGDGQHYWITATDLNGPIGTAIDFARGEDGSVMVVDDNEGKARIHK